jgi:hypothetical protein
MIRFASIDLNLLNRDAVLTPVVVVAAIDTDLNPEIETLLANSVLMPPAVVAGPVEAAGACVAGVSAVVLELPPPPHAESVSVSKSATKARRIDFIRVSRNSK